MTQRQTLYSAPLCVITAPPKQSSVSQRLYLQPEVDHTNVTPRQVTTERDLQPAWWEKVPRRQIINLHAVCTLHRLV